MQQTKDNQHEKNLSEQVLFQIYSVNIPNLTPPQWEHFVLVFNHWCWRVDCCGYEMQPNISGNAPVMNKGLAH